MEDVNETLKKVLTLMVAFIVIVLVALALMLVVTFILKATLDIANAPIEVITSAALLVSALIIAAAIFAKK